ncbi:MAG: hypothetical protein AAF845_15950 [Bacteroidota bacterium]
MRTALALTLLLTAASGQAQSTPPLPEADPADVATTEAIVAAAYASISGPADEARDWDRFRSLFLPDARLVPTGPLPDGSWSVQTFSPQEYADIAAAHFRDAPIYQGKGFYEIEAAHRTERFGNIAHVWSTYESRLDPSEEPFMRGINTIQLVHDGERWWIATILWQHESEAAPIPDAYLSDGD